MVDVCLVVSVILLPCCLASQSLAQPRQGDPRFLNLITWVKFDNEECAADTGDNGTCYTSTECAQYGGVAQGSCAAGFGVCCVLQYNCGSRTNHNSTYFVNNGYPSSFNTIGQCSTTIEKTSPNVCQLRLDFDEMEIQQPDPTTHQCTSDRFVVTGGAPVPIICGHNTGQHMYIDAGSGNSPVSLTFITTGDYERAFKMKVTHVECGAVNRAVEGCLQYHTSVSGTIRSFNFMNAEGLHLSNQEYSVCIRSERGFCGISYTACTDMVHNQSESFTVSEAGLAGEGPPVVKVGDACTTDWVAIPCATTSTAGSSKQAVGSTPGTCVDRLCGEVFCSVTSSAAGNSSSHCPVYSYIRPFTLRLHFDSDEALDGSMEKRNRGFCLDYVQQPCTS